MDLNPQTLDQTRIALAWEMLKKAFPVGYLNLQLEIDRIAGDDTIEWMAYYENYTVIHEDPLECAKLLIQAKHKHTS